MPPEQQNFGNINTIQSKLLLSLLILEIPILISFTYVYIINNGTFIGYKGSLLVWMMFYLFPAAIYFFNLIYKYTKNSIRGWKKLSNYSAISFLLYWIQLALVIKYTNY